MPGKTEGGEAAEAVDGTGPEGGRGPGPGPVPRKGTSLTTPAAQDTAPDEAPAFTGEEPMVASQESSGTLQKGLEGSPDASFTSKPGLVCGGFLTQPRLPPLHCCYWAPSGQGPNSWEALQVPEPGAPGLPWSPDSRAPQEPLPRGQCLIHNWVEERATNELDRVLHHEESEGFRYRHGHVGLLTLELSSPHTSRTTQKDSYQHPGNPRKALRGRREAMLELLLHHQIRKEVDQELSPPKYFNYESVTHHDYQRELEQPGPPPPTKPHSLQEQPETYWLQKASKLPGVSNIRTYDTPFRKNCSFSTPVPLSMDQPLPYGPENYPRL
ncbi:sperm-associated antigen 8 isoform X1 [Dromiciops gliroides]|uniref:sperm-associated antigen 8 isoform X1 n=1 Tax=Dromiciops gliroides TaxID=33562 RepID=UPI001CC39E46|nr:sperm-associated antigen 8 isoform X1 [Dromiciops gliroides]